MRVYHMSGAGNDFAVVDARGLSLDFSPLAVRLCRELGADGFMAVDTAADADFRLHFYNSDGSRGEMCGNGSRCICRFAYDNGIAGETMTVDEMIKCVVIASANDAAVALAEHVSGSEGVFVAEMNRKAKELGLYVGVADYNPKAIGIPYADEYFKIKDTDYYIHYSSVKKIDEFTVNKRYLSYIVFELHNK